MEIIWTPRAGKELRDAIAYRREVAGVRSAERMLTHIRRGASRLSTYPRLGSVEELLADQPEGFRSLVTLRRYKIIYYIDGETIYITSLFDCRQHPGRMMC